MTQRGAAKQLCVVLWKGIGVMGVTELLHGRRASRSSREIGELHVNRSQRMLGALHTLAQVGACSLGGRLVKLGLEHVDQGHAHRMALAGRPGRIAHEGLQQCGAIAGAHFQTTRVIGTL